MYFKIFILHKNVRDQKIIMTITVAALAPFLFIGLAVKDSHMTTYQYECGQVVEASLAVERDLSGLEVHSNQIMLYSTAATTYKENAFW